MASVSYGYVRVSTTDQNLDRQLEQLREYINDDRYIFKDHASGKDFNRKAYNNLVGTATSAPALHEGDLLIICSIDRLGRNYAEIKTEWERITKTIGADIKVLDMPLLDTSADTDNLDKRFIADLVLQILSYTAEKERENTRKRQRQGIDIMPVVDGKRVSKKTGRPMGRPAAQFPPEWEDYYKRWKDGTITATKAMEDMGMSRATYYKLVKRYETGE